MPDTPIPPRPGPVYPLVTLKYDQTLDLLRRAVTEHGEDYVYPIKDRGGCLYFFDGQPDCIVGHVLAYAGVQPQDVESISANTLLVGVLVSENVIAADERTLTLLSYTQRAQDCDVPWGQALQEGLNAVAHHAGPWEPGKGDWAYVDHDEEEGL